MPKAKLELQGTGCNKCPLQKECEYKFTGCKNVRILLICNKCDKAIGVMYMSGDKSYFDRSYTCYVCHKKSMGIGESDEKAD